MTEEKPKYIGSVRFYKHLILTTLALMIIVPWVLCTVMFVHIRSLESNQREMIVRATPTLPPAERKQREIEGEMPYYTELYPDFYAPESDFEETGDKKLCYLTFDDGPSDRTDEVLAILAEEDIKATFFVVKRDSEINRSRLAAVTQAGHTVAMHSSSHSYKKIYSSVEAFLSDYYELFTWIVEATGQKPTVFRFPGGSINGHNSHIYQEIIAEMTRRGFVYYDWNISSGDATRGYISPAQIHANCISSMSRYDRTFVLMHDSVSHTATVAALPEIIKSYREAGFEFRPITSNVKPVIFVYQRN